MPKRSISNRIWQPETLPHVQSPANTIFSGFREKSRSKNADKPAFWSGIESDGKAGATDPAKRGRFPGLYRLLLRPTALPSP